MNKVVYETTEFGFRWRSMIFERACGDDKKGWVMGTIRPNLKNQKLARKRQVEIYVTKRGVIHVGVPNSSGVYRWFKAGEKCS